MKTILLAEDDPGHETLIRRALKRSGADCNVEVVRDGVQVLNYLFGTGDYAGRDPADLPHLILLDLKMPVMDGLQVLQVLRRVRDNRTSLPPVVVLTSSVEDLDVVNAYRLGAHSFIHKPVDFEKLAQTVSQVVIYWLSLNEPPQLPMPVPGSSHSNRFIIDHRPASAD